MKTEERHLAGACAQQFQTVASNWAIEDKTTTIGKDSARNMIDYCKRAFRGIRLCHGVVNGCLTKKRNISNHPIKTMAKKPKSFLFDLKRKEKCFIQPYNGLEARILFRSEEHTSELQSHLN